MGHVVNFRGRSFETKNLGWLVRHAADVDFFDLAEVNHSPLGSGILVAHLRGGGTYLAPFASYSVMHDWVRRPSFRGLPYFSALVTLRAEVDDTEVRGNAMASGDDAADKAVEDEILSRLNDGDVWAWAFVTVRAEHGEHVGEDSLGGCSYASERDFYQFDGYYPDMVRTAIDAARQSYDNALGTYPVL